MSRPRRLGRLLSAAVGLGLLTAGCINPPRPVPPPSSSTPSPAERPFTVLTAERATTFDPSQVSTDTGAMVVLNLYQRLMLVQPTTGLLKPDAAKDCLFVSATTYECSLPKDLAFSNGHPLTSSDVRFSILRALRLAPPDGSANLLASLARIETPDATTVRFRLKYPDGQFGYALAAPTASLVDEEAYDADAALPFERTPVGSGPYQLEAADDAGLTIAKYPKYVGPLGTDMQRIRIAWADSAAAEAAIAENRVEIVWRTLSEAAVSRLDAEIAESDQHRTEQGFRRWYLPGTTVQRLIWRPGGKYRANSALRSAVALALQEDRTMASLVPRDFEGYVAAFPTGGSPKVPTVKDKRLTLTLGYSATSPGLADLARTLRDRIENAVGISVLVTADDPTPDLVLTDRAPWINTTFGMLQEYLDNPLPGSAAKLADLERRAQSTADDDVRLPALGEIQKQAAADLTVLPITRRNGVVFLGRRVDLVGEAFGPGWQLALWGARWVN